LVLTLPDGTLLEAECPLFEDQHELFQSMPWWEDALKREPSMAATPLLLPDWPKSDEAGEE